MSELSVFSALMTGKVFIKGNKTPKYAFLHVQTLKKLEKKNQVELFLWPDVESGKNLLFFPQKQSYSQFFLATVV